MARVVWNVLEVDLMGGSSDPVLGVFAPISKDLFVYFIGWGRVLLVEANSVGASLGVTSEPRLASSYYILVDVSCSHSEVIILGRYEASVARKVFFSVIF